MNFVRALREIYGEQLEIDLAYQYGKQNNLRNEHFKNEYQLEPLFIKSKLGNIIKKTGRLLPLQISLFDEASNSHFKSLVDKRKYDYILFRYLTSTQLCRFISPKVKPKIIIDYDDVAASSLFDSDDENSKRYLKRVLNRINRFVLMRYEKKCLKLGAALFCSQADMESVRKDKNIENTFVVPNIYSIDKNCEKKIQSGFKNKNVLLFVGTLNYPPNVKGLMWFYQSIFEKFKENYNDAELIVVGRKPTNEVRNIFSDEKDVKLFPDVDDVKPFYKKSRAVVVPILSGSGTRIKILESVTMERPVFTTPAGVLGLDFRNDKEILLFDNANDFLEKYSLINNKDSYSQIVEQAKKLAGINYSKEKFKVSLKKVMKYMRNEVL